MYKQLIVVITTVWIHYVWALDPSAVLRQSKSIHTGPSIAAAAAIVIGLLVCFYGYRLLKPAIFVCGFLAGGLLVALIIEYAFPSNTWFATASWIGFLVGGFITGILVLLLYNVGLFIIGALAGTLLAFTFNTSFAYRFYPSQPDVVLVIMIITLGLLIGVLAWKIEKPVVVLATSFIGATSAIWGIGYFLGKYPSGADLKHLRYKSTMGKWTYNIPTAWWVYLGATVFLFIIGVIVQYRSTARGVSHTQRETPSQSSYPEVATPDTRGTHECRTF